MQSKNTCGILLSMESREFKRKRGGLGLTQAELAEMLEIRPNTVSRYETGLLEIPKAVELALETVERRINESEIESANK